MPRIAALRIIDGEVYAKIEVEPHQSPASITLWSPAEIEEHDKQLFMDICRALYEAYKSGEL